MKRMLFNATQQEESRVAIVDGQKLISLDIETLGREQRKGNIYKGVITKIEPSLEACFVDYGANRHGFLPFKEINKAHLNNQEGTRTKIQDALSEGTTVLVQIEKDERGNKGAALTTYISLAGRYMVLMPNNPRGGGVSRRVEGKERLDLKNIISQLNLPRGMSVIARTAGIGRSIEELQWDLDYQLKLWDAVVEASKIENIQPLILQESALVIRAIRDHFQPDIGEILVDNQEVFEKVYQFISFVMPQNLSKVKLYQDHIPLFSRFQIETQIDLVYSRQVSLPSGGEIVIDHTEALVSIDVNSAKATKGADVEETAFQTNLEAAEEVSRQMSLRDIGGLVVIDFIDMEDPKHQREVENALKDFLKEDRARIQMTKLSRFGLMEISRQRLQAALGESTHMSCPRCHGTGVIRSVQSSALHILRVIEEKALKGNTEEIHAQLPVDVATFLLNEKREQLFNLEDRLEVPIIIIPNKYLETPNYQVERIRSAEVTDNTPSYTLVDRPIEEEYESNYHKIKESDQIKAAVQGVRPSEPLPEIKTKKPFLSGVFSWVSNLFGKKEIEVIPKNTSNSNNYPRNNRRNNYKGKKNYQNKNRKDNTNSGFKKNEDIKNTQQSDSVKQDSQRNQRIRNEENTNKNYTKNSNNSNSNSNNKRTNKRDNTATNKNIAAKDKEQIKNNVVTEKTTTIKNIPAAETTKQLVAGEAVSTQLVEKTNIKSNKPVESAESNTKQNLNSPKTQARKNNRNKRYRIPTALYIESKINVDKIARHIRRISLNVINNVQETKRSKDEKKLPIADKTELNNIIENNQKVEKNILVEQEQIKHSKTEDKQLHSAQQGNLFLNTNKPIELGGLVMIETDSDHMHNQVENVQPLQNLKHRSDVIAETAELPVEKMQTMKQIETKNI